MKNTIVGSENVWVRKAPVSERSWVRKGLGPNRLFLLGLKGLGSETSDIPNGDPTDGRTDNWNFQTNNSSMSRQVGVIKSNVKVQFSYLTKKCMHVCISNMNDTVLIVHE